MPAKLEILGLRTDQTDALPQSPLQKGIVEILMAFDTPFVALCDIEKGSSFKRERE